MIQSLFSTESPILGDEGSGEIYGQEQPTIFFSFGVVLNCLLFGPARMIICSFSSLASSFQQFLSSDSGTTADTISKHEVESSIN